MAWSSYLVVTLADWSLLVDRIIREQRRLEVEEESTEGDLLRVQDDLVRVQRELNERLARLARLRRQKRLLSQKGKKMVAENLANMDEVEESERQEAEARETESRAVADLHAMGGVGVVDWGAVEAGVSGFDFSLLPGLVPAGQGSSNGIP